jgi:hypothetical protein
MHQAYRLSAAVQRDIARVTTPSLVLHAIDDDVASTRSAQFVARNIRTPEVRTILYRDSYHILTMDNDRDAVADETIGFFGKYGAQPVKAEATHAPGPGVPDPLTEADDALSDVNTWMPGIGEGPDFDSHGREERLPLGLPSRVVEA